MKITSRLGPKVSSNSTTNSSTSQHKLRKSPYNKHNHHHYIHNGNVDGERWAHDKFQQNRENSASKSTQRQQGFTCKVSNLHPAASQEDVYTIFSQFGSILHLNFIPGQATFVFESKESVIKAVKGLNGKLADGKLLKVEFIPIDNVNIVGASFTNSTNPSFGIINNSVPTPQSQSRNYGRLYSDRIESVSSRLGSIVQRAAQEAAYSTVVTPSSSSAVYTRPHETKSVSSRLGPVTKFSVTL